MSSTPAPWDEQPALAPQAAAIERLRSAVVADDRWRWLEVGCSLGRGKGDELSDIDAGVGYAGDLAPTDLRAAGAALVRAVGPVLDVLDHDLPGRPATTRRLAVEYQDGVQLDLVLMPAAARVGLPEGSVAVVDADGRLAEAWTPSVADPPTAEQAREWAMLGWWALSDVAKYLRRGSLFEATERLAEARSSALRLFATGRRVPYPAFGLVSLLDFPPYELPVGLAATYCAPAERDAVHRAALAAAAILDDATIQAAAAIGADLGTPWAGRARERLDRAGSPNPR